MLNDAQLLAQHAVSVAIERNAAMAAQRQETLSLLRSVTQNDGLAAELEAEYVRLDAIDEAEIGELAAGFVQACGSDL